MTQKPLLLIVSSLVFSMSATAQTSGHSHGDAHGAGMKGHGSMHTSSGEGMKGHAGMHASPGASKAPFDHQFLDTMSAHHQSGMEMAQMAESKSSRNEIKGLAKMMREDQEKDIAHMQKLKQEWYGGKGDALNMQMPGMKESMKGMESKMAKLRASRGDAFDSMFLTMMSQHHQDGIKMAQTALARGHHKEVKQIAQKIIDSQKKEMDVMKNWKKDWQLSRK